ncbi:MULTISPECIES: tail fiber domain-containing protein [Marivita]|uniref:Tail fiber domain-containing protein n=1 Tax=Marivita cryptomonadis TaxID=505252 RepID=A0A9Q2NZ51_9RHOB|nr:MULTISPECIES: tail fiber domain-containing protein [Marivita]MCR9170054.1 tail fiber domain-containing protein [Paracoccaceae bacterium]MBM2322655.1 tail fiber domain-containing protein [Marivita cryptomonadis]MBM2332237.1 tail fiber domain-containing protein [Marivita cryptomonadis]MBM2341821.1 tail fiber domain-containing protein [Marivita cryptomonadis]MBM2346485.1 tail fiber domain-containing protein [Marivita cryptomonadis]
MGGKSAPKPDPAMGQAAILSAETGQQLLDMMKGQADISNRWAEEDRARAQTTFQPIEDAYIARAMSGPDYSKVEGDVRRSVADVAMQFDGAQGQADRRNAAMGVNPASGRALSMRRSSELAEAAARAGAGNNTRLQSRAAAEAESEGRMANVLNIGRSMAVNPATSLGMGSNAMQAGGQGAMQGYNQQANILSAEHGQRMQSWQANQNSMMGTLGGIGQLVGAGVSLFSSKDMKTDKKPVKRSMLDAVKKMPVEEWTYKPGVADEGRHIGPYAQDFQAATGKGDGETIPLQDMMGVTLAAIQELAAKVDQMQGAA